MNDIPTIVPLLVTGILIGTILRSTKARIRWRFAVSGSLLGGLGNVAYATGLYLFQNQAATQTIARSFTSSQTTPAQTPVAFLVLSFIVGTSMVLLIFIAAALTLRIRGRTVIEE